MNINNDKNELRHKRIIEKYNKLPKDSSVIAHQSTAHTAYVIRKTIDNLLDEYDNEPYAVSFILEIYVFPFYESLFIDNIISCNKMFIGLVEYISTKYEKCTKFIECDMKAYLYHNIRQANKARIL